MPGEELALRRHGGALSEEKTGSGQVAPHQLSEVFQFDAHNQFDLDLIMHLSLLNSYDVYIVRLALRRLGIEVEDVEMLRLSQDLSDVPPRTGHSA